MIAARLTLTVTRLQLLRIRFVYFKSHGITGNQILRIHKLIVEINRRLISRVRHALIVFLLRLRFKLRVNSFPAVSVIYAVIDIIKFINYFRLRSLFDNNRRRLLNLRFRIISSVNLHVSCKISTLIDRSSVILSGLLQRLIPDLAHILPCFLACHQQPRFVGAFADAFHRSFDAVHKLCDPVTDLLEKRFVRVVDLAHHIDVTKHHFACIRGHFIHRLRFSQLNPGLFRLLHLAANQLTQRVLARRIIVFDQLVLQLRVLLRRPLLDHMRQLMGSCSHDRLLVSRACEHVQIHRVGIAVIHTVRALAVPLLVRGAFKIYHVDMHGFHHFAQRIARRALLVGEFPAERLDLDATLRQHADLFLTDAAESAFARAVHAAAVLFIDQLPALDHLLLSGCLALCKCKALRVCHGNVIACKRLRQLFLTSAGFAVLVRRFLARQIRRTLDIFSRGRVFCRRRCHPLPVCICVHRLILAEILLNCACVFSLRLRILIRTHRSIGHFRASTQDAAGQTAHGHLFSQFRANYRVFIRQRDQRFVCIVNDLFQQAADDSLLQFFHSFVGSAVNDIPECSDVLTQCSAYRPRQNTAVIFALVDALNTACPCRADFDAGVQQPSNGRIPRGLDRAFAFFQRFLVVASQRLRKAQPIVRAFHHFYGVLQRHFRCALANVSNGLLRRAILACNGSVRAAREIGQKQVGNVVYKAADNFPANPPAFAFAHCLHRFFRSFYRLVIQLLIALFTQRDDALVIFIARHNAADARRNLTGQKIGCFIRIAQPARPAAERTVADIFSRFALRLKAIVYGLRSILFLLRFIHDALRFCVHQSCFITQALRFFRIIAFNRLLLQLESFQTLGIRRGPVFVKLRLIIRLTALVIALLLRLFFFFADIVAALQHAVQFFEFCFLLGCIHRRHLLRAYHIAHHAHRIGNLLCLHLALGALDLAHQFVDPVVDFLFRHAAVRFILFILAVCVDLSLQIFVAHIKRGLHVLFVRVIAVCVLFHKCHITVIFAQNFLRVHALFDITQCSVSLEHIDARAHILRVGILLQLIAGILQLHVLLLVFPVLAWQLRRSHIFAQLAHILPERLYILLINIDRQIFHLHAQSIQQLHRMFIFSCLFLQCPASCGYG